MPGIGIGNAIPFKRGGGINLVAYWATRKPYFTVDNTGNIEALVDAQIAITLTAADVDIASILADGSNLFFYTYGDVFVHSYINYLIATTCEVYIKVSCAALSTLYVGLKLQAHAFADDYSGVMLRRTAHASTNMLYKCDDENDSEGNGADITFTGAAVTATKFGNVIYCDGSNDNFSIAILETLTDYCSFSFNFCLPDNSWDNAAGHHILCKTWDANNYFTFYIDASGMPGSAYRWGGLGALTWAGTTKMETGRIYSLTIRWTKVVTTIYLNGESMFCTMVRVANAPANATTLYFGSHSAGVEFTKCYIWDIEYNDSSLPIVYQRSHNDNVSLFNRTQTEKITAISSLPAAPIGAYWGEGDLIIEGGVMKLYHQKSYSDADVTAAHNIYCLSISNDYGATWDAPITLMGYGTSIEAAFGIYQPFTFKDNGKYYVIWRRHNNNILYIAESTDGVTFSNVQVFLANTHGTTYNCSIINDNGIYRGLVDVGVVIDAYSSYVQYYIEGNSLLTMAYGVEQTTLGLTSKYNYGASELLKVGSKYVVWYGITPGNNTKSTLPCVITYAESDDPSANEWTMKTIPVAEMDVQYADDQVQDFSLCEYGGKTYMNWCKLNNTSGAITAIFQISKYDGTIAQFIKDITVTHSGL